MNPSSSAITWIQSHVSDWTQTDAAIAGTLNAMTVSNPVSQSQLANTCYPSQILSLLSAASLAKIDPSGFAPKLYDDMNNNYVSGVARWAGYYHAIGAMTDPEYTAITGHLSGTTSDPAWTSTIPATTVSLGRAIDTQDISAARAAGGH